MVTLYFLGGEKLRSFAFSLGFLEQLEKNMTGYMVACKIFPHMIVEYVK